MSSPVKVDMNDELDAVAGAIAAEDMCMSQHVLGGPLKGYNPRWVPEDLRRSGRDSCSYSHRRRGPDSLLLGSMRDQIIRTHHRVLWFQLLANPTM